MQVCTLLQTDNHTSTPPLCFLQAGCPSCRPTNSVKALKAKALKANNFTKLTNKYLEVDSKLVMENMYVYIHAQMDRQSEKKHNSSGPINWMDRGIK